MTPPDRVLRFLFDYISPNAYIAWKRIRAVADRHGYTVEPEPILFAGLLIANGGKGPAETYGKWRWMVQDIVRKAHDLGLPMQPPVSHPFNSLLPLRLSLLPMRPDVRDQVIDTLFEAIWERSIDPTPETIGPLLDSIGLDGGQAIRNAGSPEVKERLKRRTAEAHREDVFGVPTVLVGGRLFWGFDDFVNLERFLAGDDPVDQDELRRWYEVPTSAMRTGVPPREKT